MVQNCGGGIYGVCGNSCCGWMQVVGWFRFVYSSV